MAINSAIEWTDHTFNPWWGCQRVSPGCEHCYAETFANRLGHQVWGPSKTTARRGFGEDHWAGPLRWNKAAEQAGQRARVFCASMADVFEDHPQVEPWRIRLWQMIAITPHLDWLLLTKRPGNIMLMVPNAWLQLSYPPNVWIGTSCEDQQRANERIPHLLRVPARRRFLSCEPLLGPLDLSAYLATCEWCGGSLYGDHECYDPAGIDWVIVGGESGHGARPMHPDWARGLRDQCVAAGVAFFFKQWGEYGPVPQGPDGRILSSHKVSLFAGYGTGRTVEIAKLGKHAAGRLLDGVEWNQFPDEVPA